MAKKSSNSSLTFKKYTQLIRQSLFHPNLYANSIPIEGGLRGPVIFFIISFAIGLFLKLLIDSLISLNPALFFLGISQIVIFTPISILSLFLITGGLHIVAKLLSGNGSFRNSLRALSYSMIYMIFFWIPFIDLISYLLMLYVLTIAFKRAHNYSLIQSAINVALPFLITIVLAAILGIFNSNQIFKP